MPRIGPLGIWEILIILVVILLIFGPRRLPEMAKGIGQSVREFRKGIRDMKDDFEAGSNDQPAKKPASESQAVSTADSAPVAASEPKASEESTATVTSANEPTEPKTADRPA